MIFNLNTNTAHNSSNSIKKNTLAVEGPDVAEAVMLSAVPFAGPVVAQRQR